MKRRGIRQLGIIVMLVILGAFLLSGCGSEGESETTYYDENNNGKLDQGEWNITQDGDGNIVDYDPNGDHNWE